MLELCAEDTKSNQLTKKPNSAVEIERGEIMRRRITEIKMSQRMVVLGQFRKIMA